tara:strand:- start:11 stop:424 length:414 start_codon:yes stop_codon:yes gene_type:complete
MINIIKYLPNDINWYIACFIDDIDIRRYFNIYGKINKGKFKFLNKIIRYPVKSSNGFYKYYLENLEDNLQRLNYGIDNDLIETLIIEENDKVYIEIHIFRLIQKPYPEFISFKDMYYKGIYSDTHYWKYVVICNVDY